MHLPYTTKGINIVMFQTLCLFLWASTAFALKKPIPTVHGAKYELLKDLTEKGTDRNLAESLIDIILHQETTIKAMEKKMNTVLDQGSTVKALESKVNTLTETVNQQGGQIMVMQERIIDLESIIQRQNQDIADLEHEKDVLNDTVMSQRAEMDIMVNDMMKIIGAVHKKEGGNLMKAFKEQKGSANENTIRKTGKVYHDKDGQQSGILWNGLERRQKRSVTHVAFSSYLSHELNHLNVGRTIKMDHTLINDGNGYNRNTGIFMVPTAGVYLLTYSIQNFHKTHHVEVELVVEGRNFGTLVAYNYSSIASKTIITPLIAGQSVWLQTVYYGDASVHNTFSGVLLY